MEVIVGTTFIRATPSKRRHLLDIVGKYVTHNGFLNLIRQINPDDPRGAQITHICLQLAPFNGNTHLWKQVEDWLDSEKRIHS